MLSSEKVAHLLSLDSWTYEAAICSLYKIQEYIVRSSSISLPFTITANLVGQSAQNLVKGAPIRPRSSTNPGLELNI